MLKKAFYLFLALGLAAAGAPLSVLIGGYLKFRNLENSIVEKMDQYYLTITTPGREEYLLADDEVFDVPYMASRLSVEALPTRIYDRKDRLIGEFLEARGQYVRSEKDLPGFLKKAIVAAEDGAFYEHVGADWKAILRAALKNLRSGSTHQGGSTLTQQLAKILFTTHERTYSRKSFELFCAQKLEKKFTKDQILHMYLNFVYLGHGCYGVECAAQHYFGKPASALELAESAMLAGIIASPNNYSPFVNIEYAKARHRTVLKRMAALGYLPEGAVGRYSREFWKVMEERLEAPEASIRRMKVNKAPYFIEYVRVGLEKEFSPERLLRGGLTVKTTLDLDMQRAGKEALRKGLIEERNHYSLKAGSASAVAGIEGGLAAVDAQDGAILTLVGGSGFTIKNQFDRAANGRRPVGSAIKPFVYASSFESGDRRPQDKISDEIARYPGGRGESWSPRNYGGKYYGEVTLETALHKSLNTVAVKLLAEGDIDDVIRRLSAASGADISNFPRNLTLALGSAGLTPLELAASYAVFANGGRPVRPYAVLNVSDRSGQIVFTHPKNTELAPVISTATAFIMRDMMSGVIRPGGTAYFAARAAAFNRDAAGKTGTTDDYRDAWFAGIIPGVAAAVRIGNDDMRFPLGPGRSGGAVAAPIWMRFILDAMRYQPTLKFDRPEPS